MLYLKALGLSLMGAVIVFLTAAAGPTPVIISCVIGGSLLDFVRRWPLSD